MRQDPTTTDFADFGHDERREVREMLIAWNNFGLPADFYDEEVRFMFNRDSGMVFLTNSEYQCVMINPNKCSDPEFTRLEMWHSCPNCGHEGFAEDCEIKEDYCTECCPWTQIEEEAKA